MITLNVERPTLTLQHREIRIILRLEVNNWTGALLEVLDARLVDGFSSKWS